MEKWLAPAAQSLSTVTKITAVCEMVIITMTKLVNGGLNILQPVEKGSMKFAWQMEQI
jgi:hypothetical protein